MLHLVGKRLLPRGDVRCIDAASGHAGQDCGDDVRELAGEHTQDTNLVSGAGAATAEHQREIGLGSGRGHVTQDAGAPKLRSASASSSKISNTVARRVMSMR